MATSKPGFLKYKAKALPKINALRLANSLVNITSVPVLDKGQVMFSPAASAHNEPRSCYNCHMYNERAQTCQWIGPSIPVKKFTYPMHEEQDSKPIEYWPVCSAWDYGSPSQQTSYKEKPFDSPEDLGLGWINAPKVGLTRSGTCCGGGNNGDDCDNYLIDGEDKRATKTGFCRVLQTEVGNLDCCTAFIDDDWVHWQDGIKLIEELAKGYKAPNPFLK